MNEFDARELDGRLLQVLVAVCEERSITRAAQRLQVTQSAVSHLLEKLRMLARDPLFVRCGRGIVPTARAETLAQRARVLLDAWRAFALPEDFDPARLQTTLTIAANDLQRDLLLPPLLARLRARAPALRLRVLPSGVPSVDLLRDARLHLAISPRPPDSDEIVQQRLFEDRYRVYYDPAVRAPPRDAQEYLAAEHISVLYEDGRPLAVDRALQDAGVERRFAVWVPAFSGVPPFLRGSVLLATLPGVLRAETMRGFASCEVPVPCPPLPMYMIWHRRYQHDPLHRWLREELQALVAPALARIEGQQPTAARSSPGG
ncbi:MAG: LysR family transcriptional regulator [Burkholderiaceae bacterium]|nr:LysR family transcriptional regulator [Burkholderiaceae bacterium]